MDNGILPNKMQFSMSWFSVKQIMKMKMGFAIIYDQQLTSKFVSLSPKVYFWFQSWFQKFS